MEEIFKLIGFLNVFEVPNEFIYPVFEFEGKYYTQSRDSYIRIESFEPLANDQFVMHVEPFYKYQLEYNSKKYDFKIGDEAIYGLQIGTSKIFLGNFSALKKFVSLNKFEDDYLNIEAPYFVKSTEKLILSQRKNK